jgi:RNA polymerase sigma-70 factor (ECF subfamily)
MYVVMGSVLMAAEPVTVKSTPPVVVKSIPVAGDTAVDAAIKDIRVTFSKDMATQNAWSWCLYSPETFPVIDQKGIRYLDDKRTCVLPVKLEPGKTYAIWVNNEKFRYFKDTNGLPAVPYLLVFQTRK